jgi:hypothetical protein
VDFASPGSVNVKGAPICTAPAFLFSPRADDVVTLTDGRDTVQLRFSGPADTGLDFDRTMVSVSQRQSITVRRNDGQRFAEPAEMGAWEGELADDGRAFVLRPRAEHPELGRVTVSVFESFTAPSGSSDFFAEVHNQALTLVQSTEVQVVP